METIIIARHQGAVEWLKSRGITGEVLSHVSNPAMLNGRVVVGILPLNLAARAEEVWAIDMPKLPPELRGKELTPAQMDEAGAVLSKYRVTAI